MLEQNRQQAEIEEAEQRKMEEERKEAERKRIAMIRERRRLLEESVYIYSTFSLFLIFSSNSSCIMSINTPYLEKTRETTITGRES